MRSSIQAAHQPFSTLEQDLQASASRQAKEQLVRVPWKRFRFAYESYPEWHALSLWSRIVLTSGQHAIPQALKALRKRCPKFLATGVMITEPNLLGFRLLEWVHSTVFGYAKREGWLDALTFYGVRHARSEAYWALWERCENEWSKAALRSVPSFEQWKSLALEATIGETVSYSKASRAVERFIDLEATVLWVQPLLASGAKLPNRVARDLKSRLRSSNHRARRVSADAAKRTPENWRLLIRVAKQDALQFGTTNACRATLIRWVRSHPRHDRLNIYGKKWSCEQPQKSTRHYPSFRLWQFGAEHYVADHADDASLHRHE